MVLPDSEWDAAWIARCQEIEDEMGHVICGAPTSNDKQCRKRPIRGQIRCREHIRAAHMRGGDGGRAALPTTRVAVVEVIDDRSVVERWTATFEERLPAELRGHFEVLHDRTITSEMMLRELIGAQRARLHTALIQENEIGILDPQVTAEMSLLTKMVNDLGRTTAKKNDASSSSVLAMAKYAFDVEAEVDNIDFNDSEEE